MIENCPDFDPNVDDIFMNMEKWFQENIIIQDQAGRNVAIVKKFSICYSKILPRYQSTIVIWFSMSLLKLNTWLYNRNYFNFYDLKW